MATITASTSLTRPTFIQNSPLAFVSSPLPGLQVMAKMGRVRCSMEEDKAVVKECSLKAGRMTASLMAAASAAAMSSPAAMALVDERLSTEGTGLPFGLSNNLLGWILFGMFGFIWSLYFVYTSGLDEDDDSGLSL